MIICTTSCGHYPEEFFDIPEELYEKLKVFSKKYPIWSDCPDRDLIEELKNSLLPYQINVPTFCTYA